MSRETERHLKNIMKLLDAEGIESEEELDAFLEKINSSAGAFAALAETDDAYEAYEAYELGCELIYSDDPEDEREAVKQLKKAIRLDPPFYDARLQLLMLEPDTFKLIEKLKALEAEAEQACIEDSGVAREEVVGQAWGILELRPCLRIKYRLAMEYMSQGMVLLARRKFEEIMDWNEGDNQGCRLVLIGIYAYLEDEKYALELYNSYGREQSAWTLLSLAVLYFKLNDKKTCLSFIKKLAKAIPGTYEKLHNIFSGESAEEEEPIGSSYRPGSVEELRLALRDLDFLLLSAPGFLYCLGDHVFEQHQKLQQAKDKAKPAGGKKAAGAKKRATAKGSGPK